MKKGTTLLSDREDQLRLLSVAVEQSPASVVVTDTRGVIVYVNPRVVALTGYERDELLGRHIRIMRSGFHDQPFYADFWRRLLSTGEWMGEFYNRRKTGEMFWERAHISAVKDQQGRVTHYLAIKEDITLLKRQAEELLQAKEKAEASVKAKDAFLANMSHELRTPLNAINGVTQTLIEQGCPEEMTTSLELVRKAGQDLLSIIQEVLCFSGLQAGRVTLERQSFSLAPVIFNAVKLVAETAREKSIAVDVLVGAEVPAEWEGDPLRIQQVLVNLLGNAVKFTAHGRVRLSVHCRSHGRQSQLQCYVSDTGIGIPDEALGKLFQPFTQADQSITRRFGGTGLGLAISRSLARLMAGDIRVRTRSGRGTTFLFTTLARGGEVPLWTRWIREATIPLGEVTVLDDQPVRRRHWQRVLDLSRQTFPVAPAQWPKVVLDLRLLPNALVQRKGPVTPVESFHWPVDLVEILQRLRKVAQVSKIAPAPAPRTPKLAERLPLKILIADDIRTNLETLRIMLRHLGYDQVTMVDNGWKAVEATDRQDFDLVILDLHMPVMDGVSAAKEIRRRERVGRPRLGLVALTASTLEADRRQCLEAGMDDFMTKPVLPAHLSTLFERLFQERLAPRASAGGDAAAGQGLPNGAVTLAPWLDEERLAALRDETGDEAESLVEAMVSTLRVDLVDLSARITDACAARKTEDLCAAVHGVKGAALTVGWQRLGKRCEDVVAQLRKNTFGDWATWPDEFTALVEGSEAHWDKRHGNAREVQP